MKSFFYFLPLFLLIKASTLSGELSSLPQDEHNQSTKTSTSKEYKVHFLSLKRGHTIASSYFTFEDQKKFEVQIPGEKFLEAKGTYTKNSVQFKANWEGITIKQNKHYYYTVNVTGFSLLDTYIAGIMTLKECIQETHQDQKVTFLFIGMPEEATPSQNNQRKWFPF